MKQRLFIILFLFFSFEAVARITVSGVYTFKEDPGIISIFNPAKIAVDAFNIITNTEGQSEKYYELPKGKSLIDLRSLIDKSISRHLFFDGNFTLHIDEEIRKEFDLLDLVELVWENTLKNKRTTIKFNSANINNKKYIQECNVEVVSGGISHFTSDNLQKGGKVKGYERKEYLKLSGDECGDLTDSKTLNEMSIQISKIKKIEGNVTSKITFKVRLDYRN